MFLILNITVCYSESLFLLILLHLASLFLMKNVVVFSGAGISQESGINTFRDNGGLWEEYDVMEVATLEAFEKNPALVLEFYNKRREQAFAAKPNIAHETIANLEKDFNVSVITQNIDDLHERAGSTNVLHLHGIITKASSTGTGEVFEIEQNPILLGDKCPNGHQLRPFIVWFGEEVPNMIPAVEIIKEADILIVVGTSLNVYPAAGLVHVVKDKCKIFLVDPSNSIKTKSIKNLTQIKEKATIGLPIVAEKLKNLLLSV